MDRKIHLAIPAVGEYRKWAEVCARSAKSARGEVVVHYLDWSNCDRAKLEKLGSWHGSAIAWSRLFLSEILPPEVERVISVDADVLFRGDVGALIGEILSAEAQRRGGAEEPLVWMSADHLPPWERENPQIAAYCREKGLDPGEILCSGLTVINLRRWREEGWQKKIDAFLEKYADAPFLDQTALNVVCNDVKAKLPPQWGCFSGDANAAVDYDGDCAIHFVSDAPWERRGVTKLESDAVKLWREAAGLKTGGWRRWAYLALRWTYGWWKGNKRLAWHFRNAAPKKKAVVIMHAAPYRDPVCRRLEAKGATIKAIYGRDPNHPWAIGDDRGGANLWALALGGEWKTVVWTAYWPLKFLLPIVVRMMRGAEYAIAVDTVREEGGRVARWVKGVLFRRAKFIWTAGRASEAYLTRTYGLDQAKLVGGLYLVETTRDDVHGSETFLCVANDRDFRRLDVLVEGFRRYGKGRLILCGEGTGKYAGDRVETIEGVEYAALDALYARASCYVHNGSEQYSTAVQIAARKGLPVICSRAIGIAADLDGAEFVDEWRSAEAWRAAFVRFESGEKRAAIFNGDIDRTAEDVWKSMA